MKQKSLQFLFALAAGAIYSLAYPSFMGGGFFPFLFLALILFLWKLEKANFTQNLILILGYNLGLSWFGYYWIPHTMREFGQLPLLVSFLLGAFTCLILQPHWWIYAIWKKLRPQSNWQSESNILITAFILTILERFIPQQFPSFVGSPWLHLAPYLGLAPFFGVAIYSFVTYWISLECITQLYEKKLRLQPWIILILFLIFNTAFPLVSPSAPSKLPVRVVQANIGNFLKISSESGDKDSFESISQLYEGLSSRENGFIPHLIIWPETAHPDTFYGTQSAISESFQQIMQKTGAEMLIGGYDQDLSKSPTDFIESVYNSSLLLNQVGIRSIYHKNILIPFGETLPFGPLNRQIVSIVPAISLFAKGSGTPVMETRAGFRFITPICYEILETNYMRTLLNQWGDNHFIVNHTNDSWYGDTSEPHQHLFLSKWRALEFQLPIIRSTNTGITSVIYPDGTESTRLNVNETGVLDVNIPLHKPQTTFYLIYGAWGLILLFGGLYSLTYLREKIGNRP